MARTHSTYTASPTRWRSPQRSPARQSTSEDGSQYEMDLDALGLNSTFESTEIDEKHQPKVDVVDTSDIEGPEDFTMNMTYWMTADLSAQRQIKSRKEANIHITEVRGDTRHELEVTQDTTGEGDRAVIEESSRDQVADAEFNSASPTMRAKGTTVERSSSKAPSEASMENEEKVRSYLSALPDTDIGDDALTSTPLRIPKQGMLQVPSPSATKARSLQATVEDYDTPRKPTQETVIHHPVERNIETERDDSQRKLAELQSRLEQQELASKTRITELETLLSYTRSDLDIARTEGYKQKEQISSLQQEKQQQQKALESTRASVEDRLKAQEKGFDTKLQEFGEELCMQNDAKMQNQRADFERKMRALEKAKLTVDAEIGERDVLLEQVKAELDQLRRSHEQELRDIKIADSTEEEQGKQDQSKEKNALSEALSSVVNRANTLEHELEKATAEAKAAREEAQASAALHASAETSNQAHNARILDLESRLLSAQSQLESAQANVATNGPHLQRISDLESRLQSLQLELHAAQAKAVDKEQPSLRTSGLETRLETLQSQLDATRTDAAAKDQQIMRQIEEQDRYEQRLNMAQGRIESLEATVSTLRQQLAEAHRDSAKARTDAEQFEKDLEDVTDRLHDARAEADRRVADAERKLSKMKELKLEAESGFKELQSQHEELVEENEAKLEDVRDKAEDAVRKAGSLLEQERSEKKRVTRELKKASSELDRLRAEAVKRTAADEEDSSDEISTLSSHTDAKDTEIENLRIFIRKQSATIKTIKSETTTLREQAVRLKATQSTSETLQSDLAALRLENEKLKVEAAAREEDFQAVNRAMDERLAAMLSKVLKERAQSVVGKRDGQWAESMSKVSGEKDLMGKVLLREWGRQEVGVAREEVGERQGYRYKYVSRS